MDDVLAIILAGGQGERLSILAQERAKPAIPFAGKYRIIDFTLSNCVNSGIHNIAILSQYEPISLIDHIGIGSPWDLDRPGCKIRVLQAHLTRGGRNWYKGTADAVYQNLGYIEEQGSETVLVLSGDHIYTMDYAPMVKFHRETGADVTLAATPFIKEELVRFGTVIVNQDGQVVGFEEKVKNPRSNLVSMGIYIFRRDALEQWLREDARTRASKHDFGHNVIPRIIDKGKVFAYYFDGYWRDVGTVQAYWQANMDLFEMSPSPLFDAGWPIRTKEEERPPAILSETADVIDSMVSTGCVIEGRVEHSVLSPGVMVLEGTVVKDSIVMSDTTIGPHSVINHSILDKEIVVEAGCHIGNSDDRRANREEPKLLNTGITLVGKKARIPPGVKIGCNCVIDCGLTENDFTGAEVPSGETLKPARTHTGREI